MAMFQTQIIIILMLCDAKVFALSWDQANTSVVQQAETTDQRC